MPGSSLWLLLPASHPLSAVLPPLIQQTAARFNSPHTFIPHVTLTSEIDPSVYSSDPQAWLSSLKFPSREDVRVKLGKLESQDVFFKKLHSRVEKEGVKEAGRVARSAVDGFGEEAKAREWVEGEWMPHLSLL